MVGRYGSRQPINLRSVGRVWERNFWVYRKRWHYALVPNFFEPVFYLLGLGVGLGAYVATGGTFENGYLHFVATGLVASAAMNGAVFETTYNVFVKLHFGKTYDAMVTTRVNMEDVVLGETLWASTRSLLYGGVFLFVTLFFGVTPSWRMVLVLGAVFLTGFCFASIGMAFTAILPSIELYSYFFTMFVTPLFLFSDIFFPVADRFPDGLVTVAAWTPLYRSVQLVRGLVDGDWTGLIWHVLYLLALGSALTFFAVRRMRNTVIR